MPGTAQQVFEGGGLFLALSFLLNYFLFNLFLFLQNSGGGGAKAPSAPPSVQSLNAYRAYCKILFT